METPSQGNQPKISSARRGTRVIERVAAEVLSRLQRKSDVDYNERYIDGGPKWGEHINYSDGGSHGETHR